MKKCDKCKGPATQESLCDHPSRCCICCSKFGTPRSTDKAVDPLK